MTRDGRLITCEPGRVSAYRFSGGPLTRANFSQATVAETQAFLLPGSGYQVYVRGLSASRDGMTLAYRDSNNFGTLLRLRENGWEKSTICATNGSTQYPLEGIALSHDATVASVARLDGELSLYSISPAGIKLLKRSRNPLGAQQMTFSPVSRELFFGNKYGGLGRFNSTGTAVRAFGQRPLAAGEKACAAQAKLRQYERYAQASPVEKLKLQVVEFAEIAYLRVRTVASLLLKLGRKVPK